MHELDEITAAIIDASISVHRELGPGLLESVYEVVLARVLMKHGFRVQLQTPISFEYDEMVFEDGFKLDLLVDEKVIVEIKSVERLAPRSRETTTDVSSPHGTSCRCADQFRLRSAQGRAPRNRQSTPGS